MMPRTFRLAAATALIPAALLAVACSTEPDLEPQVATMRIAIGGQTIDVDDAGVVTGGPIVIAATTSFTVSWLRADGSPDPLVTADEFEVQVVPTNTGLVTFTRTGPFAGSLNRVAAGSTTISFALLHVEENHEDFGPFNVPITVN
jgi:hypothetical protein